MFSNKSYFSVYDFMGYLVPGLLCFLGINFALSDPKEILSFIEKFSKPEIDLNTSVVSVVLLYLTGHILSFLSSITVEKYSRWTLDFPSKYLFRKNKSSFIKSVFDLLREDKNKNVRCCIIRFISRILIRGVVTLFLLPLVGWDFLFRHIFQLKEQYARPFGDGCLPLIENGTNDFFKSISNKTGENLKNNGDYIDADYFRIISHYVKENAPNHSGSINNYVTLYGFSRTTTLILVISTWVSLCHCFMNGLFCDYFYIPIFLSAFSFLMYMEFNKFYRKYSVEVFLALCTVYKKDGKEVGRGISK